MKLYRLWYRQAGALLWLYAGEADVAQRAIELDATRIERLEVESHDSGNSAMVFAA